MSIDDAEILENNEVDVSVNCPCGAIFYICLPDTPYECPKCHSTFVAKVSITKVNKKDFGYTILGHMNE